MRLAFSAALDGVIRWGMHVARGMIMCNSMIAAFLTAGRLWVVKTGECLFKISPASSASLPSEGAAVSVAKSSPLQIAREFGARCGFGGKRGWLTCHFQR